MLDSTAPLALQFACMADSYGQLHAESRIPACLRESVLATAGQLLSITSMVWPIA